MTEKDIIPQDQGDRCVPNELAPHEKGVGQAARLGLGGVREA